MMMRLRNPRVGAAAYRGPLPGLPVFPPRQVLLVAVKNRNGVVYVTNWMIAC
jgi:hypothetical protein